MSCKMTIDKQLDNFWTSKYFGHFWTFWLALNFGLDTTGFEKCPNLTPLAETSLTEGRAASLDVPDRKGDSSGRQNVGRGLDVSFPPSLKTGAPTGVREAPLSPRPVMRIAYDLRQCIDSYYCL